MKTYLIGLEIAKSGFQVQVEDTEGRVGRQRRPRRAQVERFVTGVPSSLVALEACGSAHDGGRRLRALGHEVRLIPAACVKPFVRRNKTDVRDAAAICTALKQPDMRFVRIKSGAQQAARGLERSRELLVRQHTQLRNSGRGQLAAHGLVAAQGRRGLAPPCSKPGPRSPSGPAVIDRTKQAGSMTAPHPCADPAKSPRQKGAVHT
jgi:transposase